MIQQLSFLTLLLFLLSACGEPPVSSNQSFSEEDVMNNPSKMAESRDLPTEQDQIEFTRNVNPEVVKDEQLAAPETAPVRPSAPVLSDKEVAEVTRVPSVAIKPRTKVDGTRTDAPVATSEPRELANTASNPPATAPAAPPIEQEVEETRATKPDHSAWNTLLRKHVSGNGDVDYAGFKRDINQLNAYLDDLRAQTPDDSYSRAEAMAYWINAYNAFTVKRILNDYPVSSIRDLDGGDPWKVKWIELDGKFYSLNQIEHDILRPRYGDPRIHFAVNCAAASCPPLPNQAFTAGNLNSLLETRTRAFIRNPAYNQISGGEVNVSKIFDWYGEDFGDLRTYLNKYLATPIAADRDIAFADYDWSLNKQ